MKDREKIFSDIRIKTYYEAMVHHWIDFQNRYEKSFANGTSSNLRVKFESFNPHKSDYSDYNYDRFFKFGLSFIRINSGNSLTFDCTKFEDDYLLINSGYNKHISKFCEERNLVLTNDHNALIIHATDGIVRDYKLSKLLDCGE